MHFIGHDKGPGIAAAVVMMTLLEELVARQVLTSVDRARILAVADSTISNWGDNPDIRDAREVLDKMRGLRP